jgi:hypothetical protein
MSIDDETGKSILKKLEEIERKVDLAVAAATQAKDASIATEAAAHTAADCAQKSLLAFDALSERADILRTEHIRNHGISRVPATLRIKKRNPG